MEGKLRWIRLIWLCFLRFSLKTRTYEEALNRSQKEDQIKWKVAINKELKEMAKRGV
jgi:hypothetical protein